tara:strand:+ start:3010 stop:3420 length:411 start_codon:yes stop_codon:yes gene_type:complete
MRKIAVLLILTMVFGSLAGCLGGEDDDSSVVGDWYLVSEMVVELKEDGTWTSDNDNGTWSVDGDMISITSDDSDEEISPIQFTIDDGWLWMLFESDDDKMCIGYSPDSMTQEEWDEKMNTITFPSLCDGAQTAGQN